jgi:hypothetical protein
VIAPSGMTDFRLSVLNPGGRDPEQYFDQGTGPDTTHPPINFHAFAGCTCGSFLRDTKNAIGEKAPVLLLLRGNFRAAERALTELKKHGRTVAVSLKETGLHQIADQLRNPGKLSRFLRMAAGADGCLATTPEAAQIYRLARGTKHSAAVAFIPTPYPIEDKQWDFAVPPNEQAGIFIGTREWDVPSRNHLAALLLARELCQATGDAVTVFNLDGRKGARAFAELNFPAGKLHVLAKRKAYPDYLREVAKHKIVLQLDRSHVPGQVAGDALLARTLCIGGDGAIERIAFPKFCGEGRTVDQLGSIALGFLKNTNARAAAILESQWRSAERLSFQAVRGQLVKFFDGITVR